MYLFVVFVFMIFFFSQKTAYEMRISDWSSDVCSSDLDWVANVHDTFYIIGTVAGPHPYPELVRDFQSVIGRETREQILQAEGRLPDMLIAPVGGGSNAIGLFHPFLDEEIGRASCRARVCQYV